MIVILLTTVLPGIRKLNSESNNSGYSGLAEQNNTPDVPYLYVEGLDVHGIKRTSLSKNVYTDRQSNGLIGGFFTPNNTI